MTTLKSILTGTVVVFANLAVFTTLAFAQDGRCTPTYPPPPGYPTHCVIVNGEKVWVDINNNPVPGQSEGGATFVAGESQQNPCGTTQQPERFEVVVRTGELGNIVTTLDPDRQSPPSTIISRQQDAPFPATARINVYLEARADGIDEVLRSRDLVTLVSDNVETFPFKQTEFHLEGEAEFVDREGRAILTLRETRVILTTEGN